MKNEFARKSLSIGVVIAGSLLISGISANANALRTSGLHNIFGVVIAGNVLITRTGVNGNASGASGLHTMFAQGRSQFQDDAVSEGSTLIGVGSKRFNTGHLQYNLEGNTLSIGLPTGFNLINGRIDKGGKKYYAGDLALSFEGNGSSSMPATYEEGRDFGLSRMHSGGGAGAGYAGGGGAYGNTGRNSDGQSGGSDPVAMDNGPAIGGGRPGGGDALGDPPDDHFPPLEPDKYPGDGTVSAAPVPEPATMLLFGVGLLGLGGVLRKRIRKA